MVYRRNNKGNFVKKENKFHSLIDVDDYAGMVIKAVYRDTRVAFQDKRDVAHSAILKLMLLNKEINSLYIHRVVNSVVVDHLSQRYEFILDEFRDYKYPELCEYLNEDEIDLSLLESDNDFQGLLKILESKTMADYARKEEISRTAAYKRKNKYIKRLKNRYKGK